MPLSTSADDLQPLVPRAEAQDPSSYIETLRALAPAQRLRSSERLYWSARHLKEAAIAALHPDWTELLRRVFAIDIFKCDRCGGDMKIIAIIPASEATEAILDHLGIDTPGNPATDPPVDASAA